MCAASANPPPRDEAARQAALDAYHIVDSAPEQAFDDIVRLATTLCDVPAAAIAFIDRDRLWFKARIGIDQPELPRAQSMCGHVIDEPQRTLILEDLAADPHHAHRRRLDGQPPRFYAGVPLLSPEGHALGVLSVMDLVPRTLGPRQVEALELLARQTRHLLELRRYGLEQGRLLTERESAARQAEFARQALQRRHDALRHAADHDALTGLLNRTGLARLNEELETRERLQGYPYVLVLLDVDHFKQINDRYGHPFGDRALRAVAQAISGAIRSDDVAVRYGGEEFLVVLPDTRLDRGADVAERIRRQVMTTGLPVPITVSIGVADGDPARDSLESVLDRADQALYRAKAAGRDRIVVDDTPRF